MHILEKAETYQVSTIQKIIENGKTAQKFGTVFLGDSHIQYFDLNKYFQGKNVHNCGVEGATSDFLLHVREVAVDPYNPRKIVILIGFNDLSLNYQFDKLEIAFNVYKLMEILRRNFPYIDILVISPLPMDKTLENGMQNNTQLKLLGKEIESNVKEFVGCHYVDVFEDFLCENTINPKYTKDGVHLNEEGYALLADKIKFFI